MKPAFLIVLGLIVTGLSSLGFTHPTQQTCEDLEQAFRNGQIIKSDYVCSNELSCHKRQTTQTRINAKIHSHFSSNEIDAMSAAELKEQFDPLYKRVKIGSVEYETSNIDLGDNSFYAFFYAGSLRYAGIQIADGSVMVGGNYCEVEL